MTFLTDIGVEFYPFNPNSKQKVRYVLRGLPRSTGSNQVMAVLREKGIIVSNARQIKWKAMLYGVCIVTLLPLWVITILMTEENITDLKRLTGILNFVLKIQYSIFHRYQCNAMLPRRMLWPQGKLL